MSARSSTDEPGARGRCARRRRSAPLLGLLLAAAVCGCAPRAHTVAPYRDDVAEGDALSARAAAACAARGMPRPPQPFFTDGCSAWPDANWVQCCVEHDITYWCGGSTEERLRADRELRSCVSDVAGGVWATLMYNGVRVGGWPRFPFGWRWGYGWPWRARIPEPSRRAP